VSVFTRVAQFARRTDGSLAPVAALALIPILTGAGAAIDYSRANAARSFVQAALDAALLAGAKDGSSNWTTVAANVFNSNIASKSLSVSPPSFTSDSSSTYSGSVRASVPTSLLGIVKVNSLDVGARSSAMSAEADTSCILTLDKGESLSHVSLALNGAPIVNLSGCSIRSNTSVKCNGNDGNVTKSYAAGAATACGIPRSNAPTVPDVYAGMASNITTLCGTSRPGVTWTAGSPPPVQTGFITANTSGYVEYHVCGDLTLNGNGYLTGSSPASDVVIVIENGSLIIEDSAVINTARTAFVLTGNNSHAAKVSFPNGNGKTAKLSLSPPTSSSNPWQSVAIYLDPRLTTNVDNTWGPGAEFNADGLVYLGNSNVVTDGNTASNNSKCTKFVMNSFTTNGKVNLNFAQLNCAAIGLKQWVGVVVHLVR
jgi:type II secretory pathway pseudopilin PulG